MSLKTICLLGVVMAAAVITAVLTTASGRAAKSVTNDDFRFDARTLNDAKLWTQVNVEPYYISSELDLLCAMPTAADWSRVREKNPHSATSITVFVNSVARSAMFQKESPVFPQGSVIVKQKNGRFSARNTTILYTIMRKRESGYNPGVGDWEFSVVKADGSTVEASGKIENCQGCHIKKPSSDFVFRSYVAFN
jgi:Cytochrome P460